MGSPRSLTSRVEPSRFDSIRVKAVDDQPRQPVGLGMDQPVIGRVVEPLAQCQRDIQSMHEQRVIETMVEPARDHGYADLVLIRLKDRR